MCLLPPLERGSTRLEVNHSHPRFPPNTLTLESGCKIHPLGKWRRPWGCWLLLGRHHHSGRPSHPLWASQVALLSPARDMGWGEPHFCPQCLFRPLPRDDPIQMPAQPISRPWEVLLTPSQDINLPTPSAPLTQPYFNTCSGNSTDTGSIAPGPI